VGVALAMQDVRRPTSAFLGDGDFLMGGHALWTAVHCRIPLLVLINNNQSDLNHE
jgi:thiamine pyrophosphate-dependent acetolactate synthase large subunit-like protein